MFTTFWQILRAMTNLDAVDEDGYVQKVEILVPRLQLWY